MKKYRKNCLEIIAPMLPNRGGVEDIRLEAKAKDTKKIRGQGQEQPFRGQTLSRPRIGMLEAKATDQGHSRKCSPKKNVIKKSFSGVLQFIGVARIFDWVGQNHKSHAMTSSKIRLLALNQDFANGEGLNQGLREGGSGGTSYPGPRGAQAQGRGVAIA